MTPCDQPQALKPVKTLKSEDVLLTMDNLALYPWPFMSWLRHSSLVQDLYDSASKETMGDF